MKMYESDYYFQWVNKKHLINFNSCFMDKTLKTREIFLNLINI